MIFTDKSNSIFDSRELEKALFWYTGKQNKNTRSVFMYGAYPAVRVKTKKLHIHRLLMMYWLQDKINKKYYVHHRNGNKRDASKENLELMRRDEHGHDHNVGRIVSKEAREKIAESNRRRKGIRTNRRRTDVTPAMVFTAHSFGKSFTEISKELKLDRKAVIQRYNDCEDFIKKAYKEVLYAAR